MGAGPIPVPKVAQPGKTLKPAKPKPPSSMLRRWGLAKEAVKTSWKWGVVLVLKMGSMCGFDMVWILELRRIYMRIL